MRIDSAGRLLINHSSNIAPDGYASKLQLCDTSYEGSSVVLRRDQSNGSGPTFIFAKSRSSSKGGNTIVQDGDDCGSIRWYGNDGVDQSNELARIRAVVDGTPGSNDMPGALTFWTTPDGSIATVERMRINMLGILDCRHWQRQCSQWHSLGACGFIHESGNRKTLYALATTSNSGALARFYNNNGQVGVISVSGTGTAYVESSDYRLKENVVDITDGIARS